MVKINIKIGYANRMRMNAETQKDWVMQQTREKKNIQSQEQTEEQ